jgi:hypothetical protein
VAEPLPAGKVALFRVLRGSAARALLGLPGKGQDGPHDAESRIVLSGTKVREMLLRGELPPVEFSLPEVAQVLAEAAREPAAV